MPTADENLKAFKTRFPKLPVIPICAELGEGIQDIKQYIDKEYLK